MATKQTTVGKSVTVYFAMPIRSITFDTPATFTVDADTQPFADPNRAGDSVYIRPAKTTAAVKP